MSDRPIRASEESVEAMKFQDSVIVFQSLKLTNPQKSLRQKLLPVAIYRNIERILRDDIVTR